MYDYSDHFTLKTAPPPTFKFPLNLPRTQKDRDILQLQLAFAKTKGTKPKPLELVLISGLQFLMN
jgi:hypothetical protein